jgi:hypothetical protein
MQSDEQSPGHECPICLGFLADPLELGCQHALCRLCLLKSTRLSPDGRSCPLCRSPIEIASIADHPSAAHITASVRAAVGDATYEARLHEHALEIQALRERADTELPIFAMYPGSRPGSRVALHLFEPRYKILIRRAWEGNRSFIYCGELPRPGGTGVLVRVDDAVFLPDGRANILGRGVQTVTLDAVWVEEGTGGLYHAKVKTAVAPPLADHGEPADHATRDPGASAGLISRFVGAFLQRRRTEQE